MFEVTMKNFLRNLIALIIVSPMMILVLISSAFMGKAGAIRLWGPLLTVFTKLSLMILVPKVNSASEFDEFKTRLKSRFWLWRPFFTLSVVEENNDRIQLKIDNCPFCEVFQTAGLQGMAPYICNADWKLARESRDKWGFERSREIGKGDSFCDTTYTRIENRET